MQPISLWYERYERNKNVSFGILNIEPKKSTLV